MAGPSRAVGLPRRDRVIVEEDMEKNQWLGNAKFVLFVVVAGRESVLE